MYLHIIFDVLTISYDDLEKKKNDFVKRFECVDIRTTRVCNNYFQSGETNCSFFAKASECSKNGKPNRYDVIIRIDLRFTLSEQVRT